MVIEQDLDALLQKLPLLELVNRAFGSIQSIERRCQIEDL
jgi:hypothetical protein